MIDVIPNLDKFFVLCLNTMYSIGRFKDNGSKMTWNFSEYNMDDYL